jgi:flagellar biosynthesis protein FlhG
MSSRPPSARHPAGRRLGDNVVAIASGKGGVGKTWFSITLSQALAKAGGHVLLFDGDLGLANIDIQLGLTGKRDLADVIAGKSTLRGAVSKYPDGEFDIIAGRSGSGSLANLPAKRIADLRHQLFELAEKYDSTLIDMGAGVDQPIQTLLAGAKTCLVLTTPDPTALTDAYAFIKITIAQQPDMDVRIVVNLAATRQEGLQTYGTLRKACGTFLEIDPVLSGVIRQDPRVTDSIRAQTPLLTRHPNSDAAKDVEAIAETLLVAA